MIGQLAQFSQADLTTQFAKEGSILYQLAQGIDPSPLVPRKKPEVISEVTRLEPAAATYFELVLACERILDRLLPQAKARGKVCREVRLKLKFTSSAIQEKRLPFKEATSQKQNLAMRLRACLEKVRISEAVDEVELSLILEPERGRKLSLWFEQGGLRRELSRAASELRSRFGYQPIKRTVAVEPKPLLPERQFRLVDLD